MEEKVKLHLAQYLLAHDFCSKRAMAQKLELSYRTLLKVCAGKGSRRNLTTVTDRILRYCIQHRIPLDEALGD